MSRIQSGLLYRYDKTFSGTLVDERGSRHRISLINFVRPRQIDIKYDLGKIKNDLTDQSILTTHLLKKTFSYSLCNAADFLNYALEQLKNDPFYFLTKETINLLNDIGLLESNNLRIQDFD